MARNVTEIILNVFQKFLRIFDELPTFKQYFHFQKKKRKERKLKSTPRTLGRRRIYSLRFLTASDEYLTIPAEIFKYSQLLVVNW